MNPIDDPIAIQTLEEDLVEQGFKRMSRATLPRCSLFRRRSDYTECVECEFPKPDSMREEFWENPSCYVTVGIINGDRNLVVKFSLGLRHSIPKSSWFLETLKLLGSVLDRSEGWLLLEAVSEPPNSTGYRMLELKFPISGEEMPLRPQ